MCVRDVSGLIQLPLLNSSTYEMKLGSQQVNHPFDWLQPCINMHSYIICAGTLEMFWQKRIIT